MKLADMGLRSAQCDLHEERSKKCSLYLPFSFQARAKHHLSRKEVATLDVYENASLLSQ